jgi:hypothetical protein
MVVDALVGCCPPSRHLAATLADHAWGSDSCVTGKGARICGEGVRVTTTLPASETGTVTWATTPRNSRYVRAEVPRPQPTATTPDTMVALTNPVFLGRATG